MFLADIKPAEAKLRDLGPQVARDGSCGLPLARMRGDAALAEVAGHIENGLLFLAQGEIHGCLPPRSG